MRVRLTGRRRVDRHGYVQLSCTLFGWIYEHRLVMARIIGRSLKSSEAVHHKNHDPSDNRPENLELMTVSEHVALHNRLSPKRKRTIPRISPATTTSDE